MLRNSGTFINDTKNAVATGGARPSVKQRLLIGTALTAKVLAVTAVMSAGTPNQALANEECGAWTPTVACGSGPFTGGITYDTGDTNGATVFVFSNTQLSGGDDVLLETGSNNESIFVLIQNVGPQPAPDISGTFTVTTDGDNANIEFNQTAGVISNASDTNTASVVLTTSGTLSPIVFNQSAGASISNSASGSDGLWLITDSSDITANINGSITTTGTTLGGIGTEIGVIAETSGANITLNVGSTGSVAGTGGGLFAEQSGGFGDININVSGPVSQTSATAGFLGFPSFGIAALNEGTGDINITTNPGGTVSAVGSGVISGGSVGILGWAEDGNATITTNDTVTAAGIGLWASSESGNATVTNNAKVSVTGAPFTLGPLGLTYGLLAQSSSGAATVNINADIDPPQVGGLALVSAGVAPATVNVGGNVTVEATIVGVAAVNLGDGNAVINADATSTINAPLGALGLTTGNGSVNITTGAVNANGGLGGALGLALGGGDSTVSNEGKIDADGALFGILAVSIGGNATATANAAIDPPFLGVGALTLGPGTATANVNALVEATGIGAAAANFGTGSVAVNVNAPGGAIESDGIGILTLNVGDGASTVFLDGPISGDTAAATGGDGVLMLGFLNDGPMTFTSTGNGTINAGDDGVQVIKALGNGSISVTTGASVTAGDDGINVFRIFSNGPTTVNAGAPILAGDDGIVVTQAFGNGNVSVTALGIHGLGGPGTAVGDDGIFIDKTFGNGTVTVNANGAINATDDGVQIIRAFGNGSISVTSTAGITAGDDGINIFRIFGNGPTTVNAAPIAAGDDGIVVVQAFGNGNVSVTSSTINGLGGAGTAVGDDGIFIDKNFGNGTVTVLANGAINASDDGIQVIRTGGLGFVDVTTTAPITAGDDGINILKAGGDGFVSVDAAPIAAGDDGIVVIKAFGDGNVTITATDINGLGGAGTAVGDDGIFVDKVFGNGTVTVNVNGAVNATDDGVDVNKFGGLGRVDVNVSTGSSIIAGDSAIEVSALTPGAVNNPVNIYSDGYLEGAGGFFSSTISAFADGPVSVHNDVNGNITNRTGDFGFSVVATSINGPVLLQNDGHLEGAVALTSFGSTATFNNTSFNSWETSGFSFITAFGDATINNTGGVFTSGDLPFTFITLTSFDQNTAVNNYNYWQNNGLTVISQGSFNGGTNTVYNSGVFDNSGVTVFTSFAGQTLEFFNDGGLVTMINGNADLSLFGPLQSQVYGTWVGDITAINGNYTAANFAQFGVDAILSAPGPASAADRFIINGDIFGAPTGIIVNSDPNMPGAFNPLGIPVVSVTTDPNNTIPSDFYIDPASNNYSTRNINGATTGVIDKGLFFYALQQRDVSTGDGYFHDGDDHVLVGLPDVELFQLTKAASGAQNIWHETTGVWLDRQADLRMFLDNPACVAGAGADLAVYKAAPPVCTVKAPTPGIWMKAVGAWTDRKNQDSTYTFSTYNSVNPLSVRYNTDYKQNTFGIMGGVDFGKAGVANPNDTLLVGVMGGYLTSSLDFKSGSNGFDYSGPTVGGYATYLTGNFYIDAIVKADLLKMKWNAASLAGFYGYLGQEVDATSIGVTVDSGYKFRFANSWFLEPLGTFSWVNTTIDGMNLLGNNISFANSDSVRLSGGARLGWAGLTGGTTKVEAAVTARYWYEFEDPGSVNVLSFGTLVPGTFQDNMKGGFGDVNGTLALANIGTGWSGFVNGGVKFNNDFTTYNAKGGVRYNW